VLSRIFLENWTDSDETGQMDVVRGKSDPVNFSERLLQGAKRRAKNYHPLIWSLSLYRFPQDLTGINKLLIA